VARYHFNIRNGHGFTSDDAGMDLSSDDDAVLHAIEGARSLLSAEVLQGRFDLNGQIEVTDETEAVIMRRRLPRRSKSGRCILPSGLANDFGR